VAASVVLLLVTLAGLIPSGALSAAAHACRMACCAGKPSHEPGACNAFLPEAGQAQTPREADRDEHSSHHAETMHHGAANGTVASTTTATVTEEDASSEHCQTAEHSTVRRSAPRPAPQRPPATVLAAQAFNRPCAPECAAVALSIAQARRPRESAALSIPVRPRAPTPVSITHRISNPSSSSIERRGRIRPRAPPVAPANLSA
jgi:hypothetical protein